MKIAQIAPLAESVPPRLYGGTERIVSYLTEELVAQGHDVTLFASGDSETSARLVRCTPAALRLNPAVRDPLPHHLLMLEQVRQRADEFDILHFHIDLHAVPAAADHRHPVGDDAARAAGPARPQAVLPRLPRRAPGLDLRRPARADAAGALGAHHPPRPAARPLPLQPARRPAAISPSSAASRRRSGPTAPSRSPPAPAMPLRIAAKVDNADLAYWQAGDRAAGPRQPAGRVRRRDRRAREGELPRRAPRRSSSPSTGRSPSAS